jgi:GNAT superfamily N-acetyltransferase
MMSERAQADIRRITAAETLPLRLEVLRPGRPIETARFPGDEADSTRHFGAFFDGQVVGIASVYRAEMPGMPGVAALQLRGMATAPTARGFGLGRALTFACADFARTSGAQILWCNARTTAIGFYQKLGFESVGDEFEIPDVGPHYRMRLRLGP